MIIRPRKPENNGWLDTRRGTFHVKVHRLIAQEIYNARRIYRGELPEAFDPVEIPQLEYLPPPVGCGVE